MSVVQFELPMRKLSFFSASSLTSSFCNSMSPFSVAAPVDLSSTYASVKSKEASRKYQRLVVWELLLPGMVMVSAHSLRWATDSAESGAFQPLAKQSVKSHHVRKLPLYPGKFSQCPCKQHTGIVELANKLRWDFSESEGRCVSYRLENVRWYFTGSIKYNTTFGCGTFRFENGNFPLARWAGFIHHFPKSVSPF